MSYQLVIHPKAEKEIKKLQRSTAMQVIKRIYDLAEDPRPNGYKKLDGFQSGRIPGRACYRIRIGDLRAIYTIDDEIVTVTVVQVKKRGDIY